MAEPVTSLFRRALCLVEQHQGEAYREMVACLDGLSVSLSIPSEEGLVLQSAGGTLGEPTSDAQAHIRLGIDRTTLRNLLAGRTTLNACVRGGAIDLTGPVDALSRGLRALEYFVCALLKIEEAEQLYRRLEDRR